MTTLADGGPGQQSSQTWEQDTLQEQEVTHRASVEPRRFLPSLSDLNSFYSMTFSNQPSDYHMPMLNDVNTLFHSQAGVHMLTPCLGMSLGAPLSIPTNELMIQFAPTILTEGEFQHYTPHCHPKQVDSFIQSSPQEPTFPPSSLLRQDTEGTAMNQNDPSLGSGGHKGKTCSLDATHRSQSPPMLGFQLKHSSVSMGHGMPASTAKFRFHTTLNTQTAMTKQADEIPVTYLNRGQAYSLSVVDTEVMLPTISGSRYRTFVRVSFEDYERRQNPGLSWALWEASRGTNETRHRYGKSRGLEYIKSGQAVPQDDHKAHVELDTAVFDRFSVIWTPDLKGGAECDIAIRFNFLSTDFTHSKGIKGIPVRLCVKTVVLPMDGTVPLSESDPEICYCKVMLFRDHGAQRKLSNDIAYVKKMTDKLVHQISQAENGIKDSRKWKRGSASRTRGQNSRQLGKVLKHKRTWSLSSASSPGGVDADPSLEDELHSKLQTLQGMFTSARPITTLYLRGDELDDPDMFPVTPIYQPKDPTMVQSYDVPTRSSGQSSAADLLLVSPLSSAMSVQPQASVAGPKPQWNGSQDVKESPESSHQPPKVKKIDEARKLSARVGEPTVYPSYRAPTDVLARPIACFYIARRQRCPIHNQALHQAVYLTKRSLNQFVASITTIWDIDATTIVRTVHALESGLDIEMDDDVIETLSEGQDMLFDIVEVEGRLHWSEREWNMTVGGPEDGETSSSDNILRTARYELRLTF